MKVRFWKIVCSYFFEIPIERTSSILNPHLEVTMRYGQFRLSTANAVYSFGNLYSNFSNAFKRLKSKKMNNVLVLGLGLGSVPMMLEQFFGAKEHFTLVEADSEVVRLAEKYCLYKLKTPFRTHQGDAYNFVFSEAEHHKYDLIAMDIFVDDLVPEKFETTDYLSALRQLLSEGGTLLYNRLSLTANDRKESLAFYENAFKQVFPEGERWDVGGGNWMLVATRGHQ